MNRQFFGAIELGGTKSLAVVADDSGNILTNTRISTTDSSSTLQKLENFFQRFQLNKSVGISALGIGAFGPLNLDPDSEQYGYITTTPKHGWEHTNVLNFFSEALGIPVFIDTDVNAAALGEFHAIHHTGISDLVYFNDRHWNWSRDYCQRRPRPWCDASRIWAHTFTPGYKHGSISRGLPLSCALFGGSCEWPGYCPKVERRPSFSHR